MIVHEFHKIAGRPLGWPWSPSACWSPSPRADATAARRCRPAAVPARARACRGGTRNTTGTGIESGSRQRHGHGERIGDRAEPARRGNCIGPSRGRNLIGPGPDARTWRRSRRARASTTRCPGIPLVPLDAAAIFGGPGQPIISRRVTGASPGVRAGNPRCGRPQPGPQRMAKAATSITSSNGQSRQLIDAATAAMECLPAWSATSG